MTPKPRPLSGRIARIDRGAVHDGPGVRTVVFFKGCPLRCAWCHSPETQTFAPDVLLNADRCIGCGGCVRACDAQAARLSDGRATIDRRRCLGCGRCAEACPSGARELAGARRTVDDVMRQILRDRSLYDISNGGVTLSGGEPLMQADFAIALLSRCHDERMHTAIETCGLAPRERLLEAAALADTIFYDVKIIEAARHRAMTGVSSRYILDNLAALAGHRRDVILRFPLVPGVNDDWRNVAATAAFVSSLGLSRIDLLPYHRAGIAKYARLGKPYALHDTPVPDAAQVSEIKRVLQDAGLDVRTGGA